MASCSADCLHRMLVAPTKQRPRGHQSGHDRMCVPTAGEELYHFCSVQQAVRFIKPGLESSVLFVRKLMRIQPHGATTVRLICLTDPRSLDASFLFNQQSEI
jgi:hypothetical protein